MSDAALIVCVFLLVVLFAGEPDIVDAIITWLEGDCIVG